MLRSGADCDPAPRLSRARRWLAIALLATGLPGLASAATITFDLLDPSGFGATVTLEDGEVPGTLNIDIDSVGPVEGGLVGDILAIYLTGDAPLVGPGLDASGADVEETGAFPGEPNFLVNIGPSSVMLLNDITNTSLLLSHATEIVSVEALAGASIQVWLGFDSQMPGAPLGIAFNESLTVIKPQATISMIPEPGTAAMMMLGLIGLAARTRRLDPKAHA